MFHEIILFTYLIFAQIIIRFNEKTIRVFSLKELLIGLVVMGIYLPISEEAIFRCLLPIFFGHLEYFKIASAILFGLFHFSNYFIVNNLKLTIMQIIMTCYLGYYLINLENIKMAIFAHILFNSVGIIITQIVSIIIRKVKQSDDMDNDDNLLLSYNDYYYVCPPKFRRSFSSSYLRFNFEDMTNDTHNKKKKKFSYGEDIKKDSLPEDTRKSLEDFENKRNKLREKFKEDFNLKMKLAL